MWELNLVEICFENSVTMSFDSPVTVTFDVDVTVEVDVTGDVSVAGHVTFLHASTVILSEWVVLLCILTHSYTRHDSDSNSVVRLELELVRCIIQLISRTVS